MSQETPQLNHELDALERQVVSFFVDGVRVLGMPRSIGEIYGLMFISTTPLSLDDLVLRLGISKGSASQGIRTLRSLGAIRESNPNGGSDRRAYFEAAVELKRLAGGFIREQIRPHLNSGKNKIQDLISAADACDDPVRREFLNERIDRLDHWIRSTSRVLPILQKLLGQ